MSGETDYTMLMTSLPYLGAPLTSRRPAISHIKLKRRLRVLTPGDAATLALIESVCNWEKLSAVKDDAAFAVRARRALAQLGDPLLNAIVLHRVELRSLVAAMRRRRRGLGAPAEHEKWGAGRWRATMSRNWDDPAFGLASVFPWAGEANRLMTGNETFALERLLSEVVWKELGRLSQGHHFDFVAVAAYVLRWEILERWTHYQAEHAQRRFGEIVDAEIGRHFTPSMQESVHV